MMMNSDTLTCIEAALWKNAAAFPGKTAVASGGESVSYGDLTGRILFAADRYRNLPGYISGGRIVLAAVKQVDFIYAYFGAHMAGLTVFLVDGQTKADRLAEIARLYGTFALVGFEGGVDLAEFRGSAAASGVPEFPSSSSLSYVLFTTGTTGLPKAVPHTFAGELASARLINGYVGNVSDDVELLALPISHAFGLGRLRCCLVNGQTIHLLNGVADIGRLFATFEQEHITGFTMVPAGWRYLKKMSGTAIGRFAPQLKYMEMGTAFLPEQDKREIAALFPTTRVVMNYGLTEAPRSGFLAFHEDADRLDSVGRACPGAEIAVLREDGTKARPMELGEICVRGPHVTHGYLSVDNATTFYGEFFRTGDCGFMTEEGYIYLKSRIKELINVGGEKVGPAEVDEKIMEVPGVEDCACVGVPDPGGVLGEVVKAFIVRKAGADIDFATVSAHLRNVLEPYKVPQIYEWIDEIPKAKNGKTLRRLLVGK